ncbi:hypothetical protein A5780_06095 [Nocardia sp. 852002-20019_SCH5090214]|nr:hypothetical protein A5780_06095 [Nocardia sp. 852002-20019_SCH5090214]
MSWKSLGERVIESGMTTSRPPWSSGLQISHTETSKASEWHCAQTCFAAGVGLVFKVVSSWVTLWWVVATPLGVPVVPEV